MISETILHIVSLNKLAVFIALYLIIKSFDGFSLKYISKTSLSRFSSKSLLEDKPPISNKGSLKPPYSQSTTHILEPSSRKFAAANFLDDGSKIWVVDWEYGGFNDPLFDIGGLSSNNDLDENLESEVLEMYFKEKPSKDLIIKYNAMKTASLLRETMWSMVSEITSKIEFNYAEYTSDNLKKFEESFDKL